LGIVLLALLLFLVACRKQEEEVLPTAVATAVLPGTEGDEPGDTDATVSAPTPTLEPTATAEPEPAVAVDPDLIDWPPQVIYTSPAPGEESLLDGAVTVRFDQPMDQASVEEAFEIQAANGDGSAVSGTFTWPRNDTLVFSPRSKLKHQQLYRVNIGGQAASSKGFELGEPLELFLQTVSYLEVSQSIPEDGVREVDTDSAITVLFNRPVVPLTSTGRQAGLPQPLLIEPPVSGNGEWVSTSIYRFVPDRPLAGATGYQVSVKTDFEDITGSVLEEEFSWRFATVNPEVITIMPENGVTDFDPSRPITITFNMPMSRSATEAAVSVRSTDAPQVRLDYAWSDDDRTLTVKPQQRLRLDAAYQIGIAQAARSASGEATLERDVLSGFSTVSFPAVISTRPGLGQLADRWQRGFSIQFASPMDWSTLEDRLRVEPDPGEITYFFSNTSLSADFVLSRNTEYVVTIPGDATDPYGNALGADYTWRFFTPGGDPVASLNLPQRVSQLSSSFATQVELIHRNVSRIDVALYELGLPLNLINEPFSVNEYRPAAAPLRTWSLQLDTPLEQANALPLQLADGGMLPTGVYLLFVDAPETDANARFWQNQRHTLVVAGTNIVVKEMFGETRVWVTDLASGQPSPGRRLVAYSRSGSQLSTAVSDVNGFARFETPPDDFLPGVTVVSDSPGEAGFGIGQSRWDEGVSPWQFGLDARNNAPSPVFAYIYTDRPIYRPGDTVHYKGIVRDTNYGRYAIPGIQTMEINISNASFFEEGGLDEAFTVTLDDSGTFSGEYVLSEDLGLGSYQFSLRGPGYSAYRAFSVADYRKPEFLITMIPEHEELLRGDEVDVVLEARYFFGGPATDLAVSWNIFHDKYRLAQPVPGPFYYFGDSGDFYFGQPQPFPGDSSFGNYLTGGSGQTDGEGRLTISLPADLLKDVEEGSHTVTVEASVSDLANFPVSARTSVTMHAAETYVGVVPANYIVSAGRSVDFDLLSVDWDGRTVPNQGGEVVFYRREWQRNRDSSFGAYRTLWEPVDTEVGRTQVVTDGQGKATASFVPESGGTYLAAATVTDSGGRSHTSSATVWVTDSRFFGWRTDPKERRMDLVPDKREYLPGDTARILVQSPFQGPVNAWLTIERGTLLEQQLITLQSSSDVIEIPITPGFAPNVFVSVTAVKGITASEPDNPFADIRLGIIELVVSPEQFALNLNLVPQEEIFVPGETAVYDIQVTDHRGNGVQAELSLAMVDLAVLTLKEDNAPLILEAFYERQPYRSLMGSGLFISGEGLEAEVPVEALGLGGGGGGGGIQDVALGRAVEEEEEVRSDFPDTAFWQAKIKTGANGRTSVEIPLPDSLTTWRLSSKVVSSPDAADTLVGQSSVDVVVTLPLLLRPVTPRFVTVGDVLQLGTIVNNNTNQAIEAVASLEADGLTLHAATEQSITVPAHGRQLVQWQVLVNDVESVDLTFRVEGGGFQDATKPSFGQGPDNLIPVYRYDSEDIVGTSGVLDEAGRRVEAVLLPLGVDPRQGAVAVDLSPSLAAALIETLDYTNNLEFLTHCAHAVTDRLLPNIATAVAIEQLGLGQADLASRLDRLIQEGIGQLQSVVKADGGWGWCYSEESNGWITAYALLALTKANIAGYAVDVIVMDNAIQFMLSHLQEPEGLTESYEVNRQAFFLYVLAERGVNIGGRVEALFNSRRALLDPYARAFLALSYQLTGNGGNNQQALISDLNSSVVLSATGAHWEDESRDFRNLNSDVRGTAIIIDALARIDPGNVLAQEAVRWLMVGRRAQHWATGHETAWGIQALTNWMVVSGELDADYEYMLNVNSETLLEGSFTPANITESRSASVPIGELVLDEVNFIDFQRGLGDGRLYYTVHLDSFINAELVGAASRGISVQRVYYDAACERETETCQSIDEIVAGQQVRVELTVIAPNDLLYAIVEDPIPAGAEAIDPGLETSASGFGGGVVRTDLDYRYGYWGWWYFNRIEYRDEKVLFLADFLPAGTYQYTYFLQTNIPGEYQVMPAIAKEEFFPEVFGRSDGMLFTIVE
jgi:uncharacterized protein YfaS (alpha-2-macroglobulin family)